MTKTVLKSCPFCGKPLFEKHRKANPYALCKTEGCKGAQLPMLNLDQPDDIDAWNQRIAPAAPQGEAEYLDVDGLRVGVNWVRNARGRIDELEGELQRIAAAPLPVVPDALHRAAKSVCAHWAEFGPESGFDETMQSLYAAVKASPATAPVVPDDVLSAALDNLVHDNYERSFCGSKNREADADMIRTALSLTSPATGSQSARWCPDVCPITGLPFFMWIEHHESGQMVPTYGGPFDSYTIPVKDSDGDFVRERYDHDAGGWLVDQCENVGVQIVSDQAYVYDDERPATGSLPESWREDVGLAAQMLTWGREEGLDSKQADKIDAHVEKLFAMLKARPTTGSGETNDE